MQAMDKTPRVLVLLASRKVELVRLIKINAI